MNWPEAEWKCVLEILMGQCVMIPGTMKMPLSSAHNSDSPAMVKLEKHKSVKMHESTRNLQCCGQHPDEVR